MDPRTRTTVRSLRIREDTAKYLYNLAEDSPYYDPKSRSMRENPLAGKELEAARFSGDNFGRYSGEVTAANEAQVFAWQATRAGVYAHSIAEPTKLEALKREYEKGKSTLKNETQKKLLDKYGGVEHMKRPADELLLGQTESYVEYNRQGKVIKGKRRATIKSCFKEDVYPQNHNSVFGSFWREGNWGYKCCHQFVRNSYCTGKQGIEAESSAAEGTTTSKEFKVPKLFEPSGSVEKARRDQNREKRGRKRHSSDDSDSEKELKKAMKKAKREGDRGHKYNTNYSNTAPAKQQMEAYRRTSVYSDDPMATYVNSKFGKKYSK
ncbi:hypothetical protein CAEBREN_07951 [Caenorhabditis brenneri]|uniref:Pre-mRNA-splicing factor SLU7 n=1 Tax=Caenorhabditis brenneri TaxID=135651 RepID=G0M9E6_CAEBE|nr:hypothetical protein CAEBREN_07951 [Caenorhabditis brenneri]